MRAISLGIIKVPSAGTPVSIGSTLAIVVGTEVGPFAITTGVNDALLFAVDGGADQPVLLTPGGARTNAQIVSDINGQTTGITASSVAGKVQIASNTVGINSSILIQDVTNAANSTLGFAIGTTIGIIDVRCAKIRLTPLKDNSGDIYVGVKVNFDKTTGDGLIDRLMKPLATPATLDSFVVDSQDDSNILHTANYFIDAVSSNDGVMAAIWVE